jgi:creatinine amidohydrolase
MNPKRFWADMTWQDFQSGNPGEWIAVVPVAAIEQHGPHLPLDVDATIAEGYLARVHKLLPQNLPVTFLPLQAIGKSDEHRDFPGTLTCS